MRGGVRGHIGPAGVRFFAARAGRNIRTLRYTLPLLRKGNFGVGNLFLASEQASLRDAALESKEKEVEELLGRLRELKKTADDHRDRLTEWMGDNEESADAANV